MNIEHEPKRLICEQAAKSMDKCLETHFNTKHKTVQAAFPKIDDERRTVWFLLEGPLKHALFGHAAQLLLLGNLQRSVNDLQERLERI